MTEDKQVYKLQVSFKDSVTNKPRGSFTVVGIKPKYIKLMFELGYKQFKEKGLV